MSEQHRHAVRVDDDDIRLRVRSGILRGLEGETFLDIAEDGTFLEYDYPRAAIERLLRRPPIDDLER
jgi:hypothetical protein